jgi:hypothetical protein
LGYVILKKKDLVSRKIIEFGLLSLIIFSPLPAASVPEWSLLIIQLSAILLTICFFWGDFPQNRNQKLSQAVKWPISTHPSSKILSENFVPELLRISHESRTGIFFYQIYEHFSGSFAQF